MVQMEKIITRIGKKTLYWLLLTTFSLWNLFSVEKVALGNTEFKLTTDNNWNFEVDTYCCRESIDKREIFYISLEEFLFPLSEYNEIRDFDNKKLELMISLEASELKYDFSKIMYDKYFSNSRTVQIAFFPAKEYVDVLYLDSLFETAFRYIVVRYDFESKQVSKIDEGKFGHFFYMIFKDSNNYDFAVEVYKRLFLNESLLEKKYVCYTGNEDLCGNGVDFVYTVIDGNLVYQNPLDANSNYIDFYTQRRFKEPPNHLLTDADYLSYSARHLLLKNVKYDASDFITEGLVKYSPENLSKFSNKPFAVNFNNQLPEITIQSDQEIAGLYICNGFYNDNKSYLYLNNSRVKEIEIVYNNSYSLIHRIVLEDIQNPQFIPLININEKTIKIKILSVYEGDKYNDICINCIKPIGKYSEFDFYNSQK